MIEICTTILKKIKVLLRYLKLQSLQFCRNIKTFELSTLYNTIPHAQLKDRLHQQSLSYKYGNRR